MCRYNQKHLDGINQFQGSNIKYCQKTSRVHLKKCLANLRSLLIYKFNIIFTHQTFTHILFYCLSEQFEDLSIIVPFMLFVLSFLVSVCLNRIIQEILITHIVYWTFCYHEFHYEIGQSTCSIFASSFQIFDCSS